MGMELSQSLRQSQTLAPEMRQSLNILQMTTVELRAELQHQLQTNPVLEVVSNPLERPLSAALPEKPVSGAVTERELDFDPESARAQETLGAEDGCRDYFLGNLENYHREDNPLAWSAEAAERRQRFFDNQVAPETLQDHLLAQLPLSGLDEDDRAVARALIGDIDDDGYYRGSLADVEMVYGVRAERLTRVLRVIGTFDPLGCGGRDARECLLAQLEKLDDSPWEDEARALIADWLPALAAHREDEICAALKITRVELGTVVKTVRDNLDPHPGRAFRGAEDRSLVVEPDVVVARDTRGRWRARAVTGLVPQLRLVKDYEKMARDVHMAASDRAWLNERLHAAETLLDALDDRVGTLARVAQAIVDAQPEYFEKGPSALRPLKMDQIAAVTGVHNTTVSRTVDGKYMRTPWGTVALRSFFTTAIATATGEAVSNATVRTWVSDYIAQEDKSAPLGDGQISDLIKADHGLVIARRTVAKYRGQLNLPPAAARKV